VAETVALLMSDLEGSTRLLSTLGPDVYGGLLSDYRTLVDKAALSEGGTIAGQEGDGLLAVFPSAAGALRAAVRAQMSLGSHPWPDGVALRARMGIHAGEAYAHPLGYVGLAVHGTARVTEAAWGGQVLLTEAARDLAANALDDTIRLVDLGMYRLRDLEGSQRLFQLVAPDLESSFPPPRGLDSFDHNLPVQPTSFVGREQELAEVGKLVRGARLVTLVGAGGSGKTSLGLQAAAGLLDDFPDGVWLVELAPLSDPALVWEAAVAALRLLDRSGQNAEQLLLGYLSNKRLLLVLDNCEHVVDAVARLVSEVTEAANQVRILATSREILGLPGEVTYQVAPMSTPEPRASVLGAAARFDAVRLFEQRGQSVRPDFRVDEDNVRAVAEICRRVDGMPLAIELAAARLRMFGADEIAARLDDCFRLLTSGSRTALPRHRTLEAAIAWSYDLLPEAEQALFRRLSVFSGGFTVDAAEDVGADGTVPRSAVLDLIGRLVDKSLVVAADGSRFRLLEPIRQYARLRLEDAGEGERLRAAHASHYRRLAERAEPELVGADQQRWFRLLRADEDNIRTALVWSIDTGEAETALRIAGALLWYWHYTASHREAARWLSQALELPGDIPDAVEGRALLGLGHHRSWTAFLWSDRHDDRAEPPLEQALAIFQRLGDAIAIGRCLLHLGMYAHSAADIQRAESLYQRSLEVAERGGDRHTLAVALECLGNLYCQTERFEESRPYLESALAINEELGAPLGVADTKLVLARVTRMLGDYETSARFAERALATFRTFDDPWSLREAIFHLGVTRRVQGHHEDAIALHEETLSIARRRFPGTEMGPLIGLGITYRNAGDLARADEFVRQGLRLAAAMERTWWWVPWIEVALYALAGTRCALGDPQAAARLFGAAEALDESGKMSHRPYERAEQEAVLEALEAALDDETLERLRAEGRAMTVDEAITFALDN
jgi:predicted ATPase/class 3 adenylate cyclase